MRRIGFSVCADRRHTGLRTTFLFLGGGFLARSSQIAECQAENSQGDREHQADEPLG
jgi:hypothetical protein